MENRKKKLMPLRPQKTSDDGSQLEDYDPNEVLRPECPYIQPCTVELKKISHGAAESTRNRSHMKEASRSLVCTYMHRQENELVAEAIKKLGRFKMQHNVSASTSHIICGDAKRTINLLRGISYGCWILKFEWIKCSLEAGYWVDEEAYEVLVFSGIQKSRLAKSTPKTFDTGETIYVAVDTSPPHTDLKSLLKLCGAKVVHSKSQAKVVVCPSKPVRSSPDVQYVNEKWVLDSIQENDLQSKIKYLVD